MTGLIASLRDASPRRVLLRVLVPALVLFGTACASTSETGGQSFESAASRVFGIAYQHIRERYIETVSMEVVALSGMQALKQVDDKIEVKKAKGKVQLLRSGKPVAVFQAPGRNDVDGWANLTTAVIQAGRTYSGSLKKAGAEELYKVIFDAAMLRLDRYSRYASAEQARENRASRSGFVGIGVRIRQDKGVTKIVTVFPETPAERAGLKSEDSVLKVDGVAITGMKLRQVVKRLRGPSGSQVRLTVARKKASKKNLSINIVRAHVIATTVFLKVERGIAHIRLVRFNQRTARELAKAVARARQSAGEDFKGVILDLRDNPGGLLDQAVEVSDMFLTGGQIVSTKGRHPGSFQRYSAGAGDIAGGKPMVVLINGRSASSSEIVAAALQDLNRAVLVGTNSFGKGTVQSVFRLPNEGELVLTWSRFHAPSGYTLQDLGVLPTICTVGAKKGGTDALVSEIKSGRHRTAAALSQWRRQRNPTHDRLTRLREVCPGSRAARADSGDRDVSLARRLINDAGLYAQSLQLSQTSVAGR